MDLPLASIVRKPSWKQLLIDLVITEKIDPWDVDIVKVADGFFKLVKEMEKVDFHMPANLILASAILLKYKSNALRAFIEPEPLGEEALPELVIEGEGEILPLQIKSRIPPKAPLTLNELINEMEKAIKYDDAEIPQRARAAPRETLEITLPDYDIEKEMEKLYFRMKEEMDSESLVLFSSLIKEKTPTETIRTLSPLLHLAQEKAVGLRQDRFWGEIFIKVNGWSPGA